MNVCMNFFNTFEEILNFRFGQIFSLNKIFLWTKMTKVMKCFGGEQNFVRLIVSSTKSKYDIFLSR